MRIFISPAKKMREDREAPRPYSLPPFIGRTKELLSYMRSLTLGECKEIWRCGDRIAEENFRRLRDMDIENRLTPAVFAYEGIQYQYLAARVMEEEALSYLGGRLYILSGFYGVLRAFDGVTPYRLEMQAKLSGRAANPRLTSLYSFWGEDLARFLCEGESLLLNLASKEYAKCILPYLGEGVRCVSCVFGEIEDGRVKEKGTYAKMARGEMTRFLAERGAETIEEAKGFDRLSYRFSPKHSKENTLVFLREGAKR